MERAVHSSSDDSYSYPYSLLDSSRGRASTSTNWSPSRKRCSGGGAHPHLPWSRSSTPQPATAATTTAGRAAAEGLRRLLPRGLRQWGPPMEEAAAAGMSRAAAVGGGPGQRERGRAAPGAGPRHPSGCPCCGGDGGLGPRKCWACGASRLGCAPAAPCGHCFALPHADGTAASRGFGSGAPPTWEDGLFARKEDEAEEAEEEEPGAGEAKLREEVAGAGGAQASPDPFQCSLVSGGGGALSGLPGAP